MLVVLTLNSIASNILVGGISPVLGRAGAEGLVVDDRAGSLGRAGGEPAGVHTLPACTDWVVKTSKAGATFIVGNTFVGFAAAARGCIGQHVGRTMARIRARTVFAGHCWSANVVLTLIDILTTMWSLDESTFA